MNLRIGILLLGVLLSAGCAVLDKKIVQMSQAPAPRSLATVSNAAQSQSVLPTFHYLVWAYPADELAGVAFNIWESSDVSAPIENWHLVGTTTNLTFPVSWTNTQDFYGCSAFYVQ